MRVDVERGITQREIGVVGKGGGPRRCVGDARCKEVVRAGTSRASREGPTWLMIFSNQHMLAVNNPFYTSLLHVAFFCSIFAMPSYENDRNC